MVHLETASVQLRRDATVPIAGELECDLLHRVAQLHLDRIAGRLRTPTVEAGPAQPRHLAQRPHGLPLPFLGRLPDLFQQAASPLTTAGG